MNTQNPFREAAVEEAPHTPEAELTSALAALLATVTASPPADALDDAATGTLRDALARIALAAEQAQHLGLSDIAVRIGEHVAAATGDGAQELRRLLMRFGSAASDYVRSPGAPEAQAGLLACVAGDSGALIAAEELEILRLMLGMTLEDSVAVAPAQATTGAETCIPPEQTVDPAMLRALLQEARLVLDEFSTQAEAVSAATGEERDQLISAMAEELESLTRGAAFSGLGGLAVALESLHHALTSGPLPDEAALRQLAPAVLAYLDAPTETARAAQVAGLIDGADTAALTRELSAVTLVDTAPAQRLRAVVARAEDVSLELPGDINPELLDGLLIELPVQTAAFAQAVQRIVAGRATREDMVVAKRAAHTLKGAGNTVGVKGIASLTHALEDILLALSDHGVLPNLGLSQTLSYASDCLEGMSEALTGAGAAPDDALTVLQDVLNWANRIDAQGIDVARGEIAVDGVDGSAERSAQPPEREREPAAMLRVPALLIDELLRLVGETMTSTVLIQNRISLAMKQARAINYQNGMLQQLVVELEAMVDLRGLSAPGRVMSPFAAAGEFDGLELEQYNELHTLSRRLIEVTTDVREMGLAAEEHLANLAELQEDQGRLQVENQKTVISTRMVPVSSVFSRLQRGVRQACRILDKDVELVLRGEETVMDGNVLQELIDALMHLLRNSVDHGIERAAERVAAGKPAVGRIELEFRREGDYISVRCMDDGQGLDLEAIHAHAEHSGIIAPDTALSPEDTTRLILLPGISTSAAPTQVSGRGIGMDAVNSKVRALKGSLHLTSRRGVGLTVELKLPVTLLSTHALLARVRNKVVALSTRGIEDIHYVDAEAVDEIPAGLLAYTSEPHEVVELETILNLPGDRRTKGRHGWPVLMARLVSGALRAVVVQEVLESRSVVVKPLGPYVPKVQGLIGATILGDGSVAAVIDLPESLYSPTHAQPLPATRTEANPEEAAASGRRCVLVVDDSLSARRFLVQVMREAGYDVRAASDGLEAIALLEQRVPDLIITDMEMPRMNGFELAQHVRAYDATRHVPVIMVTSRSTAKHRRQAELAGVNIYLTKPFNDHELLTHVDKLAAATL